MACLFYIRSIVIHQRRKKINVEIEKQEENKKGGGQKKDMRYGQVKVSNSSANYFMVFSYYFVAFSLLPISWRYSAIENVI